MSGPTPSTIKRLFALSGNRCAFPGCKNPLFDESGTLIADVCHIAGDRPTAKRYDSRQSENERQGFDNLIALCVIHHRIIDADEVTYTRAKLREMKRAHEAGASRDFAISDRQAEIIAAMLGGATVAFALDQLARDLVGIVRALKETLPGPPQAKETTLPPRRELVDILRYAPTGTYQLNATDEPHRRLGTFFTSIFDTAGWRLDPSHQPQLGDPRPPRLGLFFYLADRHQVSNAEQAISEVLAKCGFKNGDNGARKMDSSGIILTIQWGISARNS